MAEITLEFLARQIERVLTEQTRIRDELRHIREEQAGMREELRLLPVIYQTLQDRQVRYQMLADDVSDLRERVSELERKAN